MVTCWDDNAAVAEDSGALVREDSNVAWFHHSLHCQSYREAVLDVSTATGCPAPRLASGPTTTSQSSFKPESLQVSPRAGLQGRLQWSCWAFGSSRTQPTPPWKSVAIVSVHSRTKHPEQSSGTRLPGLGRKTVPLPLVMGRGQQARSQWEPVAKPKVKRPLRACPPHPHRRSQLPSLSCS